MSTALSTEESPLDAKLEAVIPGLFQWHTANSDAVRRVQEEVQAVGNTVKESFKTLEELQTARQQSADRKLAASFINLAQQLAGNLDVTMDSPQPTEPQQAEDLSCVNREEPPSPVATPPLLDEDIDFTKFRMVHKHKTLSDLLDEWNGVGAFHCPYGGIQGREMKWKGKWRKHINSMHFSRTKRTMLAVLGFAEEQCYGDSFDACASLQNKYAVDCNCSVAKFVELMKKDGLLDNKKPRGKKRGRDGGRVEDVVADDVIDSDSDN